MREKIETAINYGLGIAAALLALVVILSLGGIIASMAISACRYFLG